MCPGPRLHSQVLSKADAQAPGGAAATSSSQVPISLQPLFKVPGEAVAVVERKDLFASIALMLEGTCPLSGPGGSGGMGTQWAGTCSRPPLLKTQAFLQRRDSGMAGSGPLESGHPLGLVGDREIRCLARGPSANFPPTCSPGDHSPLLAV